MRKRIMLTFEKPDKMEYLCRHIILTKTVEARTCVKCQNFHTVSR